MQQSSQEIAIQHSHEIAEQPILEIPQQSSADQADDVDDNGMNIMPAFCTTCSTKANKMDLPCPCIIIIYNIMVFLI